MHDLRANVLLAARWRSAHEQKAFTQLWSDVAALLK